MMRLAALAGLPVHSPSDFGSTTPQTSCPRSDYPYRIDISNKDRNAKVNIIPSGIDPLFNIIP